MIYAAADEVVPAALVERWLATCRRPPQVTAVRGTGHLFHGQVHAGARRDGDLPGGAVARHARLLGCGHAARPLARTARDRHPHGASPVNDPAAPALRVAVESLIPFVQAPDSLGDPSCTSAGRANCSSWASTRRSAR